MAAFGAGGCKEDVMLHGAKIRHVEVGPVTDQGQVLDAEASPQQVTFVLLRAIRDDVLAGGDQEAREKAFQRQLDVCAAETIYKRYERQYDPFPVDRDESVYKVVHSWAPTLARYVGAFDLAWREAGQRFVQGKGPQSASEETATVFVEADDPDGDPNASVVVQISLTREKGFWRVSQVGFYPDRRRLAKRTTQPSSQPAPNAESQPIVSNRT
jgi:hypothetical protein